MAMTINIEIQGSVICYRQGSYWQFVFICDRWHPVNLTYVHGGSSVTKPLRKNNEDRHIIFDFHNANIPANPEGTNFDKILNMAGDKLHDKDAEGKAKVKRKRKNAGAKEIVFMLIPALSLNTIRLTDLPYEVALDEVSSPTTQKIGHVAKIIGGTITLNAGNGGAMLFNDGGDNIPFPFQEGATHTLKFDNDCGQNCERGTNDFRLFYNWLEDRDNPNNKRFIAGKVGHGASARKDIESSDQGNCDPIGCFPPPGP